MESRLPSSNEQSTGPAEQVRPIISLVFLAFLFGMVILLAPNISPYGAFMTACSWALFSLAGFVYYGLPALSNGVNLGRAFAVGVSTTVLTTVFLSFIVGRLAYFCPLLGSALACLILWSIKDPKGSVHGANERSFWSPFFGSLLLLALVIGPISHVGIVCDEGRIYRPYFNYDGFGQVFRIETLLYELPPREMASWTEKQSYYWFGYVVSASALAFTNNEIDVFDVHLTSTLIETLFFVLLLYGLCERVSKSSLGAFMAVTVGSLSLSYDGLVAIVGRAAIKDWHSLDGDVVVNSDLTQLFGAPDFILSGSMMNFCLFTVQHMLAAIYFFTWYLELTDERSGELTWRRAVLQSLLLLPIAATSLPFGILAYGVVTTIVLSRLLVRRSLDKEMASLGAVFLGLSVGYKILPFFSFQRCSLGRVVENLSLPVSTRLLWLPLQLFTTTGVLFLLGIVATIIIWRDESESLLARVTIPTALFTILASFFVGRLVLKQRMLIELDLKAGAFLLILLTISSAVVFARLPRWREHKGLIMFFVVLFAMGLPTTYFDLSWYMRLDGKRTAILPRDDEAAFAWMRKNIPVKTIVQCLPEKHHPYYHGPGMWIPVFAGRPQLVSPFSNAPVETHIPHVKELFKGRDEKNSWQIAQRLNIGYLYLTANQKSDNFKALDSKFRTWQKGFELAWSKGNCSIWRVRKKWQ